MGCSSTHDLLRAADAGRDDLDHQPDHWRAVGAPLIRRHAPSLSRPDRRDRRRRSIGGDSAPRTLLGVGHAVHRALRSVARRGGGVRLLRRERVDRGNGPRPRVAHRRDATAPRGPVADRSGHARRPCRGCTGGPVSAAQAPVLRHRRTALPRHQRDLRDVGARQQQWTLAEWLRADRIAVRKPVGRSEHDTADARCSGRARGPIGARVPISMGGMAVARRSPGRLAAVFPGHGEVLHPYRWPFGPRRSAGVRRCTLSRSGDVPGVRFGRARRRDHSLAHPAGDRTGATGRRRRRGRHRLCGRGAARRSALAHVDAAARVRLLPRWADPYRSELSGRHHVEH